MYEMVMLASSGTLSRLKAPFFAVMVPLELLRIDAPGKENLEN
jgi:hypothetical protein